MMTLIGQYDSPFVRRVAVTLNLYGLPYEHRPWSVWSDAERIAAHNPLRRVPVLVAEDGAALVESSAIIDALDEHVGPERALLPRAGPVRREGLRLVALSSGLADKAVSLLYEPLFREVASSAWIERCETQILATLEVLEADRSLRSSPYWLGQAPTHPDVALACALRFTREAHPKLYDPGRFPALDAQADRCEALGVFRSAYQRIVNNLGGASGAGAKRLDG